MTVFRPCIDLHHGQVKQIVGGTLDTAELKTNFVSEYVSLWACGAQHLTLLPQTLAGALRCSLPQTQSHRRACDQAWARERRGRPRSARGVAK